MKTASWMAFLSILASCAEGPGGQAQRGGAEARICGLDATVEELVVADAAGLLQDAAVVGGVVEAEPATLSYEATLFGSLSGVGQVDLGRCARGEDPGPDSCSQMGDSTWSCARLACEDQQIARVEAWFSPDQGSSFTLDRGEGQALKLSGQPTYTWTLSAADGYGKAQVSHEVKAQLTDEAGRSTDLSHTVQGTISRGEARAALEISWTGLEQGRTWSTRLSMDGDTVAGALLRDGEQVASLDEGQPRDPGSLELAWRGCEGPARTDVDIDECEGHGRSGCPPVHS